MSWHPFVWCTRIGFRIPVVPIRTVARTGHWSKCSMIWFLSGRPSASPLDLTQAHREFPATRRLVFIAYCRLNRWFRSFGRNLDSEDVASNFQNWKLGFGFDILEFKNLIRIHSDVIWGSEASGDDVLLKPWYDTWRISNFLEMPHRILILCGMKFELFQKCSNRSEKFVEAFSDLHGWFLSDLGYWDRPPVSSEDLLLYRFGIDEIHFRNLLAVDFCDSELIFASVWFSPF